jgi:Flp pilus assembly protein TadG
MHNPGPTPPADPRPSAASFLCDGRGSVLVEAAFALPLLIGLLFGILIYGSWFMTAHNIQQAANDAARVALAGLDDIERRSLVDQSVARSLSAAAMVRADDVQVTTSLVNGYYSVRLVYDLDADPLFAASPIPLPTDSIEREAVVRIEVR